MILPARVTTSRVGEGRHAHQSLDGSCSLTRATGEANAINSNPKSLRRCFRTPTLRNIELTAPYMHNGRLMTLPDVIAFYARGGDIKADLKINPDMHPLIRDIDFLAPYDKVALHFFLLCLTDENVRYERAPFDHPSLHIVNGYQEATEADGKHLEKNHDDRLRRSRRE
ncbi:hypothetical protein [Allorhodopirellula heiligendammensis]|uniref:Uncharacterized protein n=1 Tax=Allorhodopirellula heiligendammensis TaxID=2714739 RepID=A0A5C6BXZ8_9BACT|nr:hypothetical protein [Allorhodopirellula heiligendammensis]TWU15509.1 hypothetical protein Poly21_27060 [Allorhodopirellula heiligendammensis]